MGGAIPVKAGARHIGRRGALRLGAGAGAVVALAACGGDGPGAAMPAGVKGGDIAMALVTLGGQSVDPHLTRVANLAPIVTSCFEQFSRWGPEGTLIPALATRMEESPDHLTLAFTLREGVTFWDGSPLTTEDVRWSFERYTTLPAGDTYQKPMNDLVDAVTATDARTVVVRMKKPSTARLSFGTIHPQGWNVASRAHYERVGEDRFRFDPMGTGPFRVARNEPPQFVRLEAHPGHYERPPSVASVSLTVVAEQAVRVDQLLAGRAGFIDGVAGDVRKQFEGRDGFRVYESESAALASLFYQEPEKPPYNDLRVRQALQLATDQEALVRHIFGGSGGRAPAAHVFPVTSGYEPSAFPPQPFDPKKAKALLEAAGHGGGLRVKVWAYDSSSMPLIPTLIQAIGGMWREVGVTMELALLEAGMYLGRYADGSLDGMTALASGSWFDGEALLATDYLRGADFATPMPDEVSERIEALGREFDEPRRLAGIREVYRIIQEGAWNVTLPWAHVAFGVREDRVASWKPAKSWAYPHAFETLVAAG